VKVKANGLNEECENVKMWKCENPEGRSLLKAGVLFMTKD